MEVCANGEDGLHQALTVENDLIILDVMLPERDGWSILAALRKAGKQTPVLFLTARDTVYDKVKGLELGADDYVVKPFDFAELLARVRTILRHGPARQAQIVRVADLQLDLPRCKASRADVRLDLTAKELALLELLVRRSRRHGEHERPAARRPHRRSDRDQHGLRHPGRASSKDLRPLLSRRPGALATAQPFRSGTGHREIHHGPARRTVSVQSELGKGSTFTLKLPSPGVSVAARR